MRNVHAGAIRHLVLAVLAGAVIGAAGCEDLTEPLLDFTDPDIINPTDVASEAGAEALRVGALGRFSTMTSGGENTFLLGGLLADEWRSGDTFQQRNETDQRNIDSTNTFMDAAFRSIHRTRIAAQQALGNLRQFKPSPRDHQGQMFFLLGFAENQAGESFCSGIPFSDGSSGEVVYGEPLSTQQVFERAVTTFDSALANAPDSARIRNAARVGKARALLNLGRYADAAAAVTGVPVTFEYLVTHSATTQDNANWALNNNAKRYVVADLDGGNGEPFVSANDPRLPRTVGGKDFEGNAGFVAQLKYGRESSVAVASGVEAQLIIAEAQLAAGNPGAWLLTLNSLRTRVPGLAPLVDPGTADARIDLTFSERAFWLYGTGHRLGDLRRLIREYNRDPETVFPTGVFPKGGNYGTDVTLPIPTSERNNPKYTAACDKSQA